MHDDEKRARFEMQVLPHLDAAYGLARWLARDVAQAEEAVQEAFLRAFRFFGSFQGEDARPWLLGIVRNTCYTQAERERQDSAHAHFDEELHAAEAASSGAVLRFPVDPEAAAIGRAERELVHRSLAELPAEYREAVVLRELQGCSYREIARIAGIPIGTVMSRLARGRKLLQRALALRMRERGTGT